MQALLAGGLESHLLPGRAGDSFQGQSTTKKDPVRFALTQQRSVLRYWKKHHGATGRLGMSCVIFGNLVIRWGAALVNYLTRPAKREIAGVRMQVFSACLRALFFNGAGTA